MNNIREAVTQKMIEALHEGLPPWRMAWHGKTNTGSPCNFASGRRYTGVNPLLLLWSSMAQGFESKHWGGENTWLKQAGAVIKEGELPTFITLFRFINKTENGKIVRTKKGDPVKVPILKTFDVFNIDQVGSPSIETLLDGRSPITERMLGHRSKGRSTRKVELLEIAERYCGKRLAGELVRRRMDAVVNSIINCIDAKLDRYRALQCAGNSEPDFQPAEDLLKQIGAKVIHRGDRAVYRESSDVITMPPKKAFSSIADYYETRFHETIHWGIRRVESVRKAIKESQRSYAFEELIAEIGACFLTMEIGIPMSEEMLEQSQSYVKGWLKHMESDPKFIFDAATHASKVADYLLGFVEHIPVKGVQEHDLAA